MKMLHQVVAIVFTLLLTISRAAVIDYDLNQFLVDAEDGVKNYKRNVAESRDLERFYCRSSQVCKWAACKWTQYFDESQCDMLTDCFCRPGSACRRSDEVTVGPGGYNIHKYRCRLQV